MNIAQPAAHNLRTPLFLFIVQLFLAFLFWMYHRRLESCFKDRQLAFSIVIQQDMSQYRPDTNRLLKREVDARNLCKGGSSLREPTYKTC